MKNLFRALFVVLCVVLGAESAVSQSGYINIKSFGAVGDGQSHPLSSVYGSLAAAQAVYPFVSDLTQEVDWAATQAAIDYAYLHGNQNVFCPGVTRPNFSNGYLLSLPIFLDPPNNARARDMGFPNWEAGVTYGNENIVIYNGLPWISLGAGNIGNTPTQTNGYPATITIQPTASAGYSTPFANVQISNASPAVVTLTNHSFPDGTPLIFSASSGGSLPTGIAVNTVYYTKNTGSSTFNIAATPGGASINTSSAGSGVFTITSQVWAVTNQTSPSGFTDRSNLIGDDGLPSNVGCIFKTLSNTGPGILVGSNNGNLVKNVSIYGPSSDDYRCQKPPIPAQGGNAIGIGHVGIGILSSNGGASRTKLENVDASGFYYGFLSGITGSALTDSNTIEKSVFQDNCTAMRWGITQSFINSIYESVVFNSTTLIDAQVQGGVNIFGGNYSIASGISASFAVSAVSSGGGAPTMTITTPDSHLNHPLCGANLQCGYNTWVINTAHFGLIPLQLQSFNPFTKQAIFNYDPNWLGQYGGAAANTALITDVNAITKIYAAEMGTDFIGAGIEVHGVHMENDGTPVTWIKSFTGFGAGRPNILVNTLFNANMSLADTITGSQSDAVTAKFYAQQTQPFIWMDGTDLIIDGVNAGQDSGGNHEGMMIQETLPQSGQLQMRHTQGQGFINSGVTVGYYFRGQVSGSVPTSLTSGYLVDGASAFGIGVWDDGVSFLPQIVVSNPNPGVGAQDAHWRGNQWGIAPNWGLRPAPWASPCITPAQATTLAGALPALTYTAALGLIQINAAGTGYHAADVITLVGGVSSIAAQVTVDTVGGGGNILTFHISNIGNYTTAPTTFTSSGGAGTGATWKNPGYSLFSFSVGYPLLWGGTLYHKCDWNGGSQTKYAVESTNTGYSYFQNLTTTNVPNLSWANMGGSPIVYLNQEALQLMFPGLVLTLVGSGGACAGTNSVMVTEVHITQGYVTTIEADQNGSPYVPGWTVGTNCTGTSITQAAPNLVNPF